MSDFNFKVGDKIHSPAAMPGSFIQITAIGEDSFLGRTSGCRLEVVMDKCYYGVDREHWANWQLYQEQPALPEKVALVGGFLPEGMKHLAENQDRLQAAVNEITDYLKYLKARE